jgi:hypothetical protein
MSSPGLVLLLLKEDTFLCSIAKRFLEPSVGTSGSAGSKLDRVRWGGADAGRGGNDLGWGFGLDLNVFRGGDSRASLKLRFVGEEGADEDDVLVSVSAI